MKIDVIVIGAGPAGLFAAINCSQKGHTTIILEKKALAGRKLLMSGSGQCNLTQAGEIKKFFKHYGENGKFLRTAFYKFTNKNLMDFFINRGINFTTTSEGKVFPSSYKAVDILDCLLRESRNLGVKINYSEGVQGVKLENGDRFLVDTGKVKYHSRYLILANGGCSYPTTGSTGDGYSLASSLGHSIKEPSPALTPVYIKNYNCSDLAGISLKDTAISLWRNEKLVKRWSGDILFTHKGLSGPGILNFSRYIKPHDIIRLKLLDVENEKNLSKDLISKINNNGKSLVKNIMKSYPIPQRLGEKIVEIADISEEKKAAQLNKEERKTIAKLLFKFPFIIERLGGFNEAMVTSGGINLKEINSATMESKFVPNLYIIGEVLDLDGDTGGYNLQAAFSTAFLAGQNIKKTLDN